MVNTKFEEPKIEYIYLDSDDIITTSAGGSSSGSGSSSGGGSGMGDIIDDILNK